MGPAAAQSTVLRSAALRSAVAPEPVPQGEGADPAALLQGQRSAECELAEALARFQSEVRPAAEMSLAAVVEAARGAFRLGFAYTSCRGLDDDGQPLLEVTVLHRGGDQLSSQVRLVPGGMPSRSSGKRHGCWRSCWASRSALWPSKLSTPRLR